MRLVILEPQQSDIMTMLIGWSQAEMWWERQQTENVSAFQTLKALAKIPKILLWDVACINIKIAK